MSYETKTLGYALQQISPTDSRFFIPAMQRPFVWKKSDVVKLFGSIYQGFPIGSSLIWRTTYNNPGNLGAGRAFWVPTEHHDNMQAKQAHLDHGSAITLVLDGQQRLSSLNIGIRGEWWQNGKSEKLCFDPNYSNEEAFRFINLDKEDLGHLIPCDQILKWDDEEYFRIYLNKYFTMFGSNQNNPVSKLEANINRLRTQFWKAESYCTASTRLNPYKMRLTFSCWPTIQGKSSTKLI